MKKERKERKSSLKLFDYKNFKSNQKQLTKTMIIIWLVLLCSFFLRGLFLFPSLWLRWVSFFSFLVIISTFQFVLISLGKLRVVNWSVCITLWLFLSIGVHLIGVIITPILFLQMSILATAIFLLGWKGGLTVLLFVLISSFFKPYLESISFFAAPMELYYPLVSCVGFLIVLTSIFVLWYYTNNGQLTIEQELEQEINSFDTALKEKESVIAALKIRLKRADTLYKVNRILHKDEFANSILYQKVVDFISQTYDHHDQIGMQLSIGKMCYKSANFQSSKRSIQTSELSEKGVEIAIEINYLGNKPEVEDESFLEQENVFLTNLLEIICTHDKQNECTKELKEYKKALDCAAMICVTQVGGTFSYVNENFCKVSQYNCEELVGKNYSILSDVFYSPHHFNDVKALIENGNVFRGEFCNRAKDGSVYWIDSTIVPIFDENGTVFKYIAINHNITELKEAVENFRISQERYKSIINVSNTGAWEYNYDSNTIWYSKNYFSMLGSDSPESNGLETLDSKWIDLLHPDDKQQAMQTFDDFIKSDSTGFYENIFRMKHENGDWIWIWSRAKKLKDRNGNVTNISLGTHIDISERIRTEQEVRKSEQLIRKITSQVPGNTYMFEIDKEGYCTLLFNNKGTDLFNHPYETHELLKFPDKLRDIIYEDDKAKFNDTMKEAFRTTSAISFQYRVLINGHIRWRWLQAIPEKDKNERTIWYGATSDVTDLVDYITSIEQIIFDIGHVIRRPISSMIGMTKLLVENYFNAKELKESSVKLNAIALEMDTFIHELNRNYQEKRKNAKLNIDISEGIDDRNSLFK